MNVLSLFDGISAGQLALQRAGISVSQYYASEIDKYAIKVTQHHFPDTIQLGDVCQVKANALPKIDILLAGSPCQGFSFAGKQLAFEDPRSKLFFEFVRLLHETRPTWWLLENVRMKKEHEQVITNLVGRKPLRFNSALVSAQNRERLYWTNIPVNSIPKDRGIMLKDILEHGIASVEKSPCIDAEYGKAGYSINHKQSQKKYMVIQLNPSKECAGTQPSIQNRIYSEEAKSPALVSQMSGQVYKIAQAVRQVGRKLNNGKRDDNNPDIPTTQQIEFGGQKSNCLTSVSKDSLISDSYTIRKLTVNECCRLQTFPDNWFKGIISDSRAYHALGNSWTVDMVVHILQHINSRRS